MDLYGPDFFDSRDPIFSESRDPMIILSDSRDPIFNSRDPNRVPKTPYKILTIHTKTTEVSTKAPEATVPGIGLRTPW